MPELTKKEIASQGSFDAVDYHELSGLDNDGFEAVLINLKIVQDSKRSAEAKEYAQAVRHINKHAPELPARVKNRRLVIKDPKTEQALAEVVQVRKSVSATKATPKGTKTQNVIVAAV